MRLAFAALALATTLAACGDAPLPTAPAAASAPSVVAASYDELPEERWHQRYDVTATEYARCWGEEGELVTFDGAVHFVYTVKRDGMGRTTFTQHWNPQGLRGIGWDSGLKYVANGTMRSREMYLPGADVPEGYTFSDRWHFVAQGGARDFFRVVTFRFVKDPATGELVVVRERDTVECK